MVMKLKPTWKIPTKPAHDVTGYEAGERGYGEAENPFESDRADYIGTWDRDADAAIYGFQQVGRREGPLMNPAKPGSKGRR